MPTTGGALLMMENFRPGPLDQTAVEARPDVLVHTTEPLTEHLEVTGRVRATLHAATDAPTTDWVVRLCDGVTAGVSRNIIDGILRSVTTPGEFTEHAVDLWSTSHVFLAGHRVRVHVTSSNFPAGTALSTPPTSSTAERPPVRPASRSPTTPYAPPPSPCPSSPRPQAETGSPPAAHAGSTAGCIPAPPVAVLRTHRAEYRHGRGLAGEAVVTGNQSSTEAVWLHHRPARRDPVYRPKSRPPRADASGRLISLRYTVASARRMTPGGNRQVRGAAVGTTASDHRGASPSWTGFRFVTASAIRPMHSRAERCDARPGGGRSTTFMGGDAPSLSPYSAGGSSRPAQLTGKGPNA